MLPRWTRPRLLVQSSPGPAPELVTQLRGLGDRGAHVAELVMVAWKARTGLLEQSKFDVRAGAKGEGGYADP
jgi:hypothetical protein